ncbi:chloride channel protein [Paraneptunicella aestuarii]|uniref:chloride channel protein n=1 Tax=Paraneptunicella aestuarii TaxID=2831148 RepID=UPI001E38575B|nr:chloride channel protein [Paraneptunicella aestuarii]UAA38263.1 chloride channel protein [Paraneptunicella aestuarii]
MLTTALQEELAKPRTTVQLCILGIIAGICSASLIILFRLGYESIQLQYLSGVGDFASLDPVYRFLLPIAGALFIIIFAFITGFKHYRMGIPFVIHRVKQHYGTIPIRTTLNQFFGGMIALASGFSVGREGPSVHLGAAGSSFLGTWLRLPYNAVRILAGCGIAAGISASFNTPFAAVIFVMEVVLREYRIHMFIPVMLAAACGSILTQVVFGHSHELDFLTVIHMDGWLLAYLIPFGMFFGASATFFNEQLMRIIKWFRPMSMINRLLLAGVITGAVGLLAPDAMGTGLSAVNLVVQSPDDLNLLLLVLIAKVFLTMVAIGLGIPGGIIGPVVGIGVLAGVIMLLPLQLVAHGQQDLTASFALLGMAAFMTSVLHAPLAALSFVMELSHDPSVIMPAMLVIVSSFVTANQLFGNRSIFIRQLDYQKLSYTTSSIRDTLQKVGVMALIDKEYKLFSDDVSNRAILDFLDTAPTHPVVKKSQYEIDVSFELVQYDISLNPHDDAPLAFFTMQGVPSEATLAEVYELLQKAREGAVYIYRNHSSNIIGVITWDSVRNYLYKQDF